MPIRMIYMSVNQNCFFELSCQFAARCSHTSTSHNEAAHTRLRKVIRNHVAWIKELEAKFATDDLFEVVTSNPLALFTFRLAPPSRDANELTKELLEQINDDGRIYLTQTVIDGTHAIRVCTGTVSTTREDVLFRPCDSKGNRPEATLIWNAL